MCDIMFCIWTYKWQEKCLDGYRSLFRVGNGLELQKPVDNIEL